MSPAFKPRQAPLLLWGLCLITLAAGLVSLRDTNRPMRPRAVQEETVVQTAQALRISKATASLASVAAIGKVAAPAGVSMTPLVALAAPAPPPPDPGADVPTHDGPPRLMVLESGGRLVAVLENRVMRVGDKTASGEVLRRIGRTFIVLKSPAGESRRIDMADAYLPRVASRPMEEVK